jgi:hypothetical protein
MSAGPSRCVPVTHILSSASLPAPRSANVYFVIAMTAGGGVGSIDPRSPGWKLSWNCEGLTALCGKRPRNFALMSLLPECDAVGLGCGLGDGVGGTATGLGGPALAVPAVPGFGPGEPWALGPGVGCVPVCVACFGPWVGLGLGTPAIFAAGAAVGGPAGFGEAVGAVVAAATTAAVVGTAVGLALGSGTGVAAFAVGAAVGAGGRGVGGFAVGGADGTGVGAVVGGTLIATCCGPIDGTDVGTAGSWFCGLGS